MGHARFDLTASSPLGRAVLQAPRNQRTYPVWPVTMEQSLSWAYHYAVTQFAMREPGERIATVLSTCNGAGTTEAHEYPPQQGLHAPQRLVRRQIILDQAVAATLAVFLPEDPNSPVGPDRSCPLSEEFEVIGHLFLMTADGSGRSETRWGDVFADESGDVLVPALEDFDLMEEPLSRGLIFFTRDVEFQARNASLN